LADQAFAHALTGANPSIKTEATKGVISPRTTTGLTTPEAPEPITSYITTTRYTPDKFYGVVIDTGASQKSTAGYNQFLAYGKTYPTNIDTTRAGQVTVQFGIGGTSSIGSVRIQTPIGNVEFHVVQTDTPFLLCLADMDALGVYYNNLSDRLVTPEKSIPVIRCFRHPFLFWEDSLEPLISESFAQNPCLLTAAELNRLHRRFGYPAADRLHKLLERAGHENVHKQAIEYLTKYCLHCQKHGKSPGRFKFVLRADQDPVFN
jgi:hypothetical protein